MTPLETINDINQHYVDKDGLVTMRNGEGGDSAHKTAHFALCLFALGYLSGALNTYRKLLELFQRRGLVRSGSKTEWHGMAQNFSRDQFTPQLVFAALSGRKDIAVFFLKQHLKHLCLFAWNWYPNHTTSRDPKIKKFPDLTLFETWALYIRALNLKFLYPLLWFYDLDTLVSCIVKRVRWTDSDLSNNVAILLVTKEIMPTPISYLARKILFPAAYERMDIYWNVKEGAPPIGKLYKELIRRNK